MHPGPDSKVPSKKNLSDLNPIQRALQEKGNRYLRSYAEIAKIMRQLVGAAIELTIAQTVILEHDCDQVRCAFDPILDDLVNALVMGIVRPD